jgi:sporulation protein YlmC with PRC-barrel domain
MFMKYMTAGLMGSAMLATAAFAQTAPATDSTSTSAATAAPASTTAAPVTASDSSYTGNWRASKVVGLNVYNANNESLGSINDLLTDQQGNIKAVVVGVGGFLGVGEHLVAVPFDKIKFVNEPVVTNTAAASPAGSTGMAPARPSAGTTTGSAPAAAVAKPNPWYPDHAVLNATKDELKALPEFKYAT